MNLRPILLLVLIVAFAAVGKAQSAGAPLIEEIVFKNGIFTSKGAVSRPGPCAKSVPKGVCGNGNSKGYYLNAKAGEPLRITLVSDAGDAVFSIFDEDLELLDERASAVAKWSGSVPRKGDIRINVFTRNGSSRFTLKVERLRR